jgi:hypothetical protein
MAAVAPIVVQEKLMVSSASDSVSPFPLDLAFDKERFSVHEHFMEIDGSFPVPYIMPMILGYSCRGIA